MTGEQAPETTTRPRGRDAIVAAVLEAAADLFAAQGPAATSLRAIATAANVNPGLIHRHIGTKEDLIVAVLQQRPGLAPLDEARRQMDLVEFLTFLVGRGYDQGRLARVHARLVLDGYRLDDYQADFPMFDFMMERFSKTLPDHEARARAVLVTCAVSGWGILAATYARIAGIDGLAAADVAHLIAPALQAMIDAPPGSDAAWERPT